MQSRSYRVLVQVSWTAPGWRRGLQGRGRKTGAHMFTGSSSPTIPPRAAPIASTTLDEDLQVLLWGGILAWPKPAILLCPETLAPGLSWASLGVVPPLVAGWAVGRLAAPTTEEPARFGRASLKTAKPSWRPVPCRGKAKDRARMVSKHSLHVGTNQTRSRAGHKRLRKGGRADIRPPPTAHALSQSPKASRRAARLSGEGLGIMQPR